MGEGAGGPPRAPPELLPQRLPEVPTRYFQHGHRARERKLSQDVTDGDVRAGTVQPVPAYEPPVDHGKRRRPVFRGGGDGGGGAATATAPGDARLERPAHRVRDQVPPRGLPPSHRRHPRVERARARRRRRRRRPRPDRRDDVVDPDRRRDLRPEARRHRPPLRLPATPDRDRRRGRVLRHARVRGLHRPRRRHRRHIAVDLDYVEVDGSDPAGVHPALEHQHAALVADVATTAAAAPLPPLPIRAVPIVVVLPPLLVLLLVVVVIVVAVPPPRRSRRRTSAAIGSCS